MTDGLILIDKPKNWTSHDVVKKVKGLLKTTVGHAGTLDPLATGLLVLMTGRMTHFSSYFLNQDKGYHFKIRFGKKTDTLDITGKCLEKKTTFLKFEDIKKACSNLQGRLNLTIPIFSAIKIDGERSYKLARKGLTDKDISDISRKKDMYFYDVKVVQSGTDWVSGSLYCKKGGYVRSWAEALGESLNTFGVIEELERFYSDPFHLDKACTLEELQKCVKEGVDLEKGYLSINKLLSSTKFFFLEGADQRFMLNGTLPRRLSYQLIPIQKQVNKSKQTELIRLFNAHTREMISVLEILPGHNPKLKCIFKPSN